MNLLLAHIRSQPATLFVVAMLCLVPVTSQAENLWNAYPTKAQPAPATSPDLATPAPKPKYYKEPAAPAPTTQTTQPAADGPSRFAPPDLERQLSVLPNTRLPPATPYGYQGAPPTPYAMPPAYVGPPPVGYSQGYPTGAPPYPGGYGGYGPPYGNNSWGGLPGNNFSPFGFW